MARLNDEHLRRHWADAEFANRMQSFELAFRMQSEATEVVDLSRESKAMHQLYGIDQPATRSYGSKCLMARRLVESGVRFVQVYSDGEWDAHNDLVKNHTHHCRATDIPVAGLLADLDARGLLDSTLVIWGWRIWPDAYFSKRQRSRSQSQRILAMDGGCWKSKVEPAMAQRTRLVMPRSKTV